MVLGGIMWVDLALTTMLIRAAAIMQSFLITIKTRRDLKKILIF